MSRHATMDRITTKQESFIDSLLGRVTDFAPLDGDQSDYLTAYRAQETLSKRQASYLITGLLRCPVPKVERKMAECGYYVQPDGTYLVVIQNRAGDATYAKRLQVTKEPGRRAKARWVYAPGKGYEVADMTPMSLQDAAKFGHLHGVCFVCCRALTDPESVKNGIGPVCAKKFRR